MTQTKQTRRNPLALRGPGGTTEATALASNGDDGARLLYNYELVAEEHRAVVMLSARRIKTKAERAKQDLLDIGKELVMVKERLAHGQFTAWVAQEFGMSLRMAQNMMNVWTVYGGKSETVSLLSDSSLYLLAAPSAPEAARQEMEVQAQERGKSPTKDEVKAAIARHRPQDAAFRQTTLAEPMAATREPLSLDEAMALIGSAVKRGAGVDPAARLRWLEAQRGYGHYQPLVKEGCSLPVAVFQAAYERVVGEVRSQIEHEAREEQRRSQWASIADIDAESPQQGAEEDEGEKIPVESTAPVLPASAPASKAAEFGSQGATAARRQRLAELMTLYRQVLSTLSEYGALTGRHTHTPAVRRALEPLIEELKGNLGT